MAGFAVPGLVWVHHYGRWYPDTGLAWFGLISSLGVIGFYASFIAADTDPTLKRLDLRLTSSGNRRRLAAGRAAGLAGWLTTGLSGMFSLAEQPTGVMRQNLTLELVVGPVFGLAGGLAVWVRYVIGCWPARREGMLPRWVGQFLDWAYSANLLRMSGRAVQFRHSALQTWLTPRSED